jgi:hypothetical protein
MPGRDDFTSRVREALSLRAGHRCSEPDCGQLTVGPSEESPMGVTNVGVAAHIAAASPGGPRYDPAMTPEQRASIENGIWLCSHHAALVDRDTVTYSVEVLHRWKRDHERRIADEVARRTARAPATHDLVALGPAVVAVGEIVGASDTRWVVRLSDFVIGGLDDLTALASARPADRYVLVSSQGDGRTFSSVEWSRDGSAVLVAMQVDRRCPRTTVQSLGRDHALNEDGDDVDLSTGDLRWVRGLDRLPQHIQICLGVLRGRESDLTHPQVGGLFSEYLALYGGTPWFSGLVKLEVIRLAALPSPDDDDGGSTELRCVERVYDVELLAQAPVGNRLLMRLVLDVAGVGRWTRDVKVFVKTPL